jgi:23S rRNA pseudouridine2605 synthase
MHPSYELEREYAVRVLGEVSPETIKMLETGVELDDGPAKFVTICDAGGQGANHWYHVTLKEGRNREVRRLWEAVGHKVSRLHRIRYGPVQLPRSVKPGRHEELDASTTDLLLGLVGLPGENKDEAVSSKHRRGKQHKRRKSKNA